MKFAKRGAKSAKRFALISAELRHCEGDQSQGEITNIQAAATALAKVCTDGDRLCLLNPSHVLAVLLDPDSSSTGEIETSIMASFPEAIRDAVRLRCAVIDLDGNLGLALETVGCEIDEHGELVPIRPPLTSSNLGSKQKWLSRLSLGKALTPADAEVQAKMATDLWTKRKVVLFEFTQEGGIPEEEQSRLLKTAHTIIKIDHPLLDTIVDYYLEGSSSFLWTGAFIEEASVVDYLNSKKPTEKQVFAWLDGLLSALIYLQTLVPHPVLPRLSDIYVHSDKSLRIAVWEPDCLLDPVFGTDTSRMLVYDFSALCLKSLEQSDCVTSVIALVQESVEQPAKLTLLRLRAAIKKIAEAPHA